MRLMAGGGPYKHGRKFKKLTEKDCHEWKLMTVDPQERSTWRPGVRSAMCAASQLPGREPTDVNDAPAHVNQKSDYDEYTGLCRILTNTGVVSPFGWLASNKPLYQEEFVDLSSSPS